MPVREVAGSALDSELASAKGALVVVDWYATWCGPCKNIAPFVERLSNEHTDVVFLKICEGEESRGVMAARGVRAFPTFQFYLSGSMVHEMKGANPSALSDAVVTHKARASPALVAFSGAGMALGGDGSTPRPEDVRAARLARLAGTSGAGGGGSDSVERSLSPPAPGAAVTAVAVAAPASAPTPGPAPAPAPSPSGSTRVSVPAGRVALVTQLIEMGFDPSMSAAASRATHGGVEEAIEWIESGGGGGGGGDSGDVAMTSGGSSGVLSGAPTPEGSAGLSEEDRAAIAAAEAELNGGLEGAGGGVGGKRLSAEEVSALLSRLRADKAAAAKEAERAGEIRRREDGRKAVELAEALATAQRKREAAKITAEKEAVRREKERLRLELLKDKATKYERRGEAVPPELLSQIAAQARLAAGLEPLASASAAGGPPPPETLRGLLDKSLRSVAAFKTGDARGLAASTLRTLLRNVLEKREEPKFRSLNLANEKIKERLVAVTGAVAFLRAAGWAKDESGTTMTLTDAAYDEASLRAALEALDAAQAPGGALTL